MGENTRIEWTHHSFNPWVGCTKVSPGCDNCYAEAWAKRSGIVTWDSDRRRTSSTTWRAPLKWNREAKASGQRRRVFCASLADVFDNRVAPEWRDDLFFLIAQTPWLDWLLLTKRIGNVAPMMGGPGALTEYPNVWLGISVVNQEEAIRDIPKLAAVRAGVKFLSVEPMLEEIDIKAPLQAQQISWVICGGESGGKARAMQPYWAESLGAQCAAADVPFFMKQGSQTVEWPDFKNIASFPRPLQVREWPVEFES